LLHKQKSRGVQRGLHGYALVSEINQRWTNPCVGFCHHQLIIVENK
jgi:hypothetical protein